MGRYRAFMWIQAERGSLLIWCKHLTRILKYVELHYPCLRMCPNAYGACNPCCRAAFSMMFENMDTRLWFCCRSSVIVTESFYFISVCIIYIYILFSCWYGTLESQTACQTICCLCIRWHALARVWSYHRTYSRTANTVQNHSSS